MPYFIPTEIARAEVRAGNSRFVATSGPTATIEAARAFIATIRAEMPDATHHVYAYVVGHGATTTRGMSDDGEPSGTAGRPVLSVLQGSGLGDVSLVVTRYFGGTLLGTGGLVHAYSDAAKAVLAVLPRQEKIERRQLVIAVEYASYEQIKRLIAAHDGSITAETFAADVTIEAVAPLIQIEPLREAIRELTAGRAEVVVE